MTICENDDMGTDRTTGTYEKILAIPRTTPTIDMSVLEAIDPMRVWTLEEALEICK